MPCNRLAIKVRIRNESIIFIRLRVARIEYFRTERADKMVAVKKQDQ